MDGMLSQDEINALLNGVDLSADSGMEASTATATMEEGSSGGGKLTEVEKDAIGEVANISMGTSATTLYSLVNKKVNITTPVVEETTGMYGISKDSLEKYQCRIGRNPYIHFVSKFEAVDINTEEDLKIAEYIGKQYWNL